MISSVRSSAAGWLSGLLCLCVMPIAACAPAVGTEPPIAAIVDRITAPATFRIAPEQAVRHFEAIASTTSKGPGKHLWVFDASEPGRGIRWLRVEFQPGADGRPRWTLLQSTIALAPLTRAYPDVYQTLRGALQERLGRPQRSVDRNGEQATEWSLGESRMVVLRRGAFRHPDLKKAEQVVLVEAVVAQGEENSVRR